MWTRPLRASALAMVLAATSVGVARAQQQQSDPQLGVGGTGNPADGPAHIVVADGVQVVPPHADPQCFWLDTGSLRIQTSVTSATPGPMVSYSFYAYDAPDPSIAVSFLMGRGLHEAQRWIRTAGTYCYRMSAMADDMDQGPAVTHALSRDVALDMWLNRK